MTQTKRILHMTSLVGRSSFGLGPIVLHLTLFQQRLGHIVNIWCYDALTESRALEEKYKLQEGTIRTFPVLGPDRLGYSPILEKAILEEGHLFDVIHQHSIWTGISSATVRWRKKTKRPTVVAPQGALDPFALRKSTWKKQLALMIYERENLHQVGCMQALSKQETNAFRSFGLFSPVAVIPNGVSSSWIDQACEPERFRARYGISEGTRILLFLGRITPKKGLPMLLKAMNTHRHQLTDWKLVIAGVDEFKHQQEVQKMVNAMSLQPYVQFIGPQFDQEKRDAFAAADVFVLPSLSEGAPVAILEALGASIPVLTTKASPWEDLHTYNCGWWTDLSSEAIGYALDEILQQSTASLKAMGLRGRKLVSDKYSWSQIAEQTLSLYDWLLGSINQPIFVQME